VVENDVACVHGIGHVYHVWRSDEGVRVTIHVEGDMIALDSSIQRIGKQLFDPYADCGRRVENQCILWIVHQRFVVVPPL